MESHCTIDDLIRSAPPGLRRRLGGALSFTVGAAFSRHKPHSAAKSFDSGSKFALLDHTTPAIPLTHAAFSRHKPHCTSNSFDPRS